MFEKEARKWVKEHTEIEYKASYGEFPIEPSAIKSFEAGAEFGYNKANKWHFVKDGRYPKEKQLVMVYRVNPLGANIAITNWYDSYKDTKVIAWKEIVLPELKESR